MAENHKKADRLEPAPPDKNDLGNVTRSYQKGWAYSEIAVQYGVAIVLCTLLGNWLDGKFDTGNILMITGLIIGAVAGFIGMLKQLKVLNTKDRSDRSKKT
jgi:F0F1-type ATP synthase assembly protein I